MKQRNLIWAGLVWMVTYSAWGLAQEEKGSWRAASSTAKTVTGDVAISDEKVAINYSAYTIAQIRTLQPAEASALFDTQGSADGSGDLYRLSIPGSKRFLHHNTLCGSDETQWMVTYVAGRALQIAFFSGPNMPVLTAEALANPTNLCGTFSYVR